MMERMEVCGNGGLRHKQASTRGALTSCSLAPTKKPLPHAFPPSCSFFCPHPRYRADKHAKPWVSPRLDQLYSLMPKSLTPTTSLLG
jgi:hypothetical protein